MKFLVTQEHEQTNDEGKSRRLYAYRVCSRNARERERERERERMRKRKGESREYEPKEIPMRLGERKLVNDWSLVNLI